MYFEKIRILESDCDSCSVAYSANCGSDRGGTLAFFPSPVFAAGGCCYKVPTATCSLYWGGLGLLSPYRSSSDNYYAEAATRHLAHNTDTVITSRDSAEAACYVLYITAVPSNTSRVVAFRCRGLSSLSSDSTVMCGATTGSVVSSKPSTSMWEGYYSS